MDSYPFHICCSCWFVWISVSLSSLPQSIFCGISNLSVSSYLFLFICKIYMHFASVVWVLRRSRWPLYLLTFSNLSPLNLLGLHVQLACIAPQGIVHAVHLQCECAHQNDTNNIEFHFNSEPMPGARGWLVNGFVLAHVFMQQFEMWLIWWRRMLFMLRWPLLMAMKCKTKWLDLYVPVPCLTVGNWHRMAWHRCLYVTKHVAQRLLVHRMNHGVISKVYCWRRQSFRASTEGLYATMPCVACISSRSSELMLSQKNDRSLVFHRSSEIIICKWIHMYRRICITILFNCMDQLLYDGFSFDGRIHVSVHGFLCATHLSN